MGSEMYTWAPVAPSPAPAPTPTPTPASEKMKSSFARTCNRFSQFLKERRSFGDLAFNNTITFPKLEMEGNKDIARPTNSEMSLFASSMETERKSLELFPLTSSSTAASSEDSTKNMVDSSDSPKLREECKTTTLNMTIFYGGKVLVLDELAEDKAQEIMTLASKGMTNSQTQTQTQTPQHNNIVTAHLSQSLSDLPIARRGSLHRFMEKRKDRIAASAPYQLHHSSMDIAPSLSKKYKLMRNMYMQQEQHQLELKL